MRALALIILLTLTACSGADLLNATIPREGYSLHRDIAYGNDPRQQLDIYEPDGATNAPVILFIYGGSWQAGRREDYRFVGEAFASKGFVTVIADYRLYPQVRYPAFVADTAAALRYTHAHIAAFGGDPADIFLAGHSAGAYNAMMVAEQHPAPWLRGIIGIAGPYDFTPTDPNIVAIFSTAVPDGYLPIRHARPGLAPALLATGDADDTVEPRNTHALAAKLREQGGEVREITYPDIGHIGIVLSLARGFRDKTTLREDISRFIDAHRAKSE